MTRTSTQHRALIIEPVKMHIMLLEPLVAELLIRGLEVCVVAPSEAKHRMAPLERQYGSRLRVLKHDQKNLVTTLLLSRFSFIFLSPRDFYSKITHLYWRVVLSQVTVRCIFFMGLNLTNRSSKLIPGIHIVDHMKAVPAMSGSRFLGFLEKHAWQSVLKKACGFSVMSRKIRQRCIDNALTDKPIHVPPVTLFCEEKAEKVDVSARPFHIVLPGRIDPRLRNYAWISHLPESWSDKLRISFVGKPHGQEGSAVIERLAKKGFEQLLDLDGSFIPEEKYDEIVGSAHMLFAPIPRVTETGIVLGVDRAIGIHYSAIRYGKPMLLPEWVPIDREFENNLIRYRSEEDLIDKIGDYLDHPLGFEQVQINAWENAVKFAPGKPCFLDDLLEVSDKGAARKDANKKF